MKFEFLAKYRRQLDESETCKSGDFTYHDFICLYKGADGLMRATKTDMWLAPYVDFYAMHPTWRKVNYYLFNVKYSGYYIYVSIPEKYPMIQVTREPYSINEVLYNCEVPFKWNNTEKFNVNDYIKKTDLTPSQLATLHNARSNFCCRMLFNPYKDKIYKFD